MKSEAGVKYREDGLEAKKKEDEQWRRKDMRGGRGKNSETKVDGAPGRKGGDD